MMTGATGVRRRMERDPVHPHGEVLWPPRRTHPPAGVGPGRTSREGRETAIRPPDGHAEPGSGDYDKVSITSCVVAAVAIARRCNELIGTPASEAEIRRIEEAKALEKEVEEEERRQRRAAELKERASVAEHGAAVVLQRFGGRFVERAKERKANEGLERYVQRCAATTEIPIEERVAAVNIQRVFRTYSLHKYFSSYGIQPVRGPQARWHRDVAAARVEDDIRRRQTRELWDGLECYKVRKESLSKALVYQLDMLGDFRAKYLKKGKALKSIAQKHREEMAVLQGDLAACPPGCEEFHDLMKQLKSLRIRAAHVQYMEGAMDRSVKRTEDQTRFVHKMWAKSAAVSDQWDAFLRDAEQRSKVMWNLLPLIASKLDKVSSVHGLSYCKMWLHEEKRQVTECLAEYNRVCCDTLSRETSRLKDEMDSVMRADDLLKKLLCSIELETKLQSEKVGSDLALCRVVEDESEEKLTHVQRIDLVSKRSLRERQGYQFQRKKLDAFYQRKEQKMAAVVNFVEADSCGSIDTTDRPTSAIPCKECPRLRPSVCQADWVNRFLSQPWLEHQSADEARCEAVRRMQRQSLEQRLSELGDERAQLEHDRARAKMAEDMIAELQDRMASGISTFKRKELEATTRDVESLLQTFRDTERSREERVVEEEGRIRLELTQLAKEDEESRSRGNKQNDEQKRFIEFFMHNSQNDATISRILEGIEQRMRKYEKKREMIMMQQDIRERRNQLIKTSAAEGRCCASASPIDWGILDAWEKDSIEEKNQAPAKTKAPFANLFTVPKIVRSTSRLRQAINLLPKRTDDPEELRMMTMIRKAMAKQGRKIEAVCDLLLTVGKPETDEFSSVNLECQALGKPYFRRIKRGIGTYDQIVVWMKKGTDQNEFLTELVLGHMHPGHDEFVNGHQMGLLLTGHDRMKGNKKEEPCVALWHKKDKNKPRVISDINISYTREDRRELAKEGYEMLQTNLSVFGLASAYMHVQYVDRPTLLQMTDTSHMAKELQDYSLMLSKNPDDPILMKMVDEMQRRLRLHQVEEEARTRCTPSDPLVYTTEFLALDETDIKKFEAVYGNIDEDKDGFISVEEFARFLCEPHTLLTYIRHIFHIADGAAPEYDKLSFGITLKGVATFCMLSQKDVLQFIFSLYDMRGRGIIANGEFLSLVSMFHPQHRGRALRALREFDLPSEGQMIFSCFKSLHENFPHLLYPAFRVQEKVRKKFLGVPWWERKQRKYMSAKEKVQTEQNQ